MLILLNSKRSRVEELMVNVSDDDDHVKCVEDSGDEVYIIVMRDIVRKVRGWSFWILRLTSTHTHPHTHIHTHIHYTTHRVVLILSLM